MNHMYIYIYIYICIHVCTYIYIYREREILQHCLMVLCLAVVMVSVLPQHRLYLTDGKC